MTFTDANGRFSFQIPDDWQARQPTVKEAVAVWESANPHGVFAVGTERAPGRSLDAYLRESAMGIKRQFPDADVDANKAQPLTLGGLPARRLEFDYVEAGQGVHLQVVTIVAIQNDVAYNLSFTAQPAAFTPFIDRSRIILGSFTFLKSTVAASKEDGGVGAALGHLTFRLLIIVGIPALIVYLVRCNRKPVYPSGRAASDASPSGAPASQSLPIWFSGGPGDAPERAVVINGLIASAPGIQEEQQYLFEQFGPPAGMHGLGSPGWALTRQTLVEHNGRRFDVLNVTLPGGLQRAIWFDISSF